MAQQDIRYYLNGLLMVLEPGKVRAVSTDGHRLAHASIAVEGLEAQMDAIIPRKTVHEMQRLLADDESPVQIDLAAGQIRFRFDQIELVSKLVEGKFPDYKRVIPTGYTRHILIPRESLQASLQRAAILTTDKLKGVRLQLGDNLLRISSSNAEQEEAREELEVDYAQEPLDVAFNVTYLLDVLANVKTENVSWSVQPDVNASVLITVPDDDEFKYVVMPMRI
jgi:DNA polymerase-3 subunit beta